MAYFPFFMDIAGREGLIVGGGAVASRKAQKLLPYGPHLTVAAPDISPVLSALPGITLLRRSFDDALLEGKFFVIAATDDHALNRRVSDLCRRQGLPVNVADDRDACSFLFPALVRSGALSVGISTGGASPDAAIWLKGQIEELLPENFPELLRELDALREEVRSAIPSEQVRRVFLKQIFTERIQLGRPLDRAELDARIAAYLKCQEAAPWITR